MYICIYIYIYSFLLLFQDLIISLREFLSCAAFVFTGRIIYVRLIVYYILFFLDTAVVNCKVNFLCIIIFEKCIYVCMRILCVDNKIFLKYDNLFVVIDILNRENFLRLTMGFGYFMYSHSLRPVIDL